MAGLFGILPAATASFSARHSTEWVCLSPAEAEAFPSDPTAYRLVPFADFAPEFLGHPVERLPAGDEPVAYAHHLPNRRQ